MTERLYYNDSYTRRFVSRVREQVPQNGNAALILEETYFYPTSGGQPHDVGDIDGVKVLDVLIRPEDGAVLHLLAETISATDGSVEANLDWTRRFDHMQQHTGQHILSQALLQVAEAATVGFHLSPDRVTIDLDQADLAEEAIANAEQLANEVVIGNHSVRAWFPEPEELEQLQLRKTPELDGKLRVVAIGDFDLSACGGTHVAATGELGMIKIIKSERHRGGQRVEFRCGWRALQDYSQKNTIISRLSSELTCGYRELNESVGRLQADAKTTRRELKQARKALLANEVDRLLSEADPKDGLRIVRRVWPDRDTGELRELAVRLAENPGTVCLLGSSGEKAMVVLARATDVESDLAALLPTALGHLGSSQGGGQPHLAQGGAVSADSNTVEQALILVENVLVK